MLCSSAAAAGLLWQAPGYVYRWVMAARRPAPMPHSRPVRGALALAMGAPLLLAGPALGQQVITVPTGTLTTSLIQLNGADDRLIIQQNGTLGLDPSGGTWPDAVIVSARGSIENNGSILGSIDVTGAAGLSLSNAGLIRANQTNSVNEGSSAITLFGGADAAPHTIVNSGTIEAHTGGIFSDLDEPGPSLISLTNSGTISGGLYPWTSRGAVDAVSLRAGTVVVNNTGRIQIPDTTDPGNTTNRGFPDLGLRINATTATVTNDGTSARIEAKNGIRIDATGDVVLNNTLGALVYGAFDAAEIVAGGTIQVTNAGMIGSTSTVPAGSGLWAQGQSATITNEPEGSMAGSAFGLQLRITDSATVQNQAGAVISSSSSPDLYGENGQLTALIIRGSSASGRTQTVVLDNKGSITGRSPTSTIGGGAYILAGTASISNSGTISARTSLSPAQFSTIGGARPEDAPRPDATALFLDAESVTGTLLNSGVISAFRDVPSLSTTGTIKFGGVNGLQVSAQTGSLTVGNTGTITGGSSVRVPNSTTRRPMIFGGSGAILSAPETVVVGNSGTIASTHDFLAPSSAGTLNLDFRGGGNGLTVSGATVSLTNTGLISTNFTRAASFTGTITDTNTGWGAISGALVRAGQVTVTNSGTIFASLNVTPQNPGTISSSDILSSETYGLQVADWNTAFIENQSGGLIQSTNISAIYLNRTDAEVRSSATIVNHAGARVIGSFGGPRFPTGVPVGAIFFNAFGTIGSTATIRNAGTIEGGTGIAQYNGTIRLEGVESGSALSGTIRGVQGPGIIVSSGGRLATDVLTIAEGALVHGVRGAGIHVERSDDITIVNRGTITADARLNLTLLVARQYLQQQAALSFGHNNSLARGSRGWLYNHGTIETPDFRADLDAAAFIVGTPYVENTGLIRGGQSSLRITRLGVPTTFDTDGNITTIGTIGTILNTGTIRLPNADGTASNVDSRSALRIDTIANVGAVIDNRGLISGVPDGVSNARQSRATIEVLASAPANGRIEFLNSGTVFGAGTLAGTGTIATADLPATAVDFTALDTMNNSGVISGGAGTVVIRALGTTGRAGTILNSGTIAIRTGTTGALHVVRLVSFVDGSLLRNTGQILDDGGTGSDTGIFVASQATGTIILENSGDGVTTGVIRANAGIDAGARAIIRGVGTDANNNPNRLTGRIEANATGNISNNALAVGRLMADLNTDATLLGTGNPTAGGLSVTDAGGVTIRNAGTMQGTRFGASLGRQANLVNEANGRIALGSIDSGTRETDAAALRIADVARLTNAGTISGADGRAAIRFHFGTTADAALNGQSATITNQATGRIESGSGATGLAIGTGAPATMRALTILNDGVIDGRIELGGGDDTYVLAQGGTQGGAVAGGAGTDLMQLGIAAGASRSFSESGGPGILAITQFETIRQTGAGLLISTGTLDSAVTLIDVQGGTFRNEGTIDAPTGRELLLSGEGTRLDNRPGARIAAPILVPTGDTGRQTVINAGTITGTISLGAGDDLVSNRGSIGGSIDLGTGNDSYIWWIAGTPSGIAGTTADGNLGIDVLLWGVNATDAPGGVTLRALDEAPPGFQRPTVTGFEAIGKAGDGTLTLDFDMAAAAGVQGLRVFDGRLILAQGRSFDIVQGSQSGGGYVDITGVGAVLDNRGTLVAANRLEMLADRTTLINSGTITVGTNGTGSITGDAGGQVIENSGSIAAAVNLGGGADLYTLMQSGTQSGVVDGGAGTDIFRFDVTGSRSFAAGAVLNFETIRQTGTGLLTLSSGTLSTATTLLDVQGGTFRNDGTLTGSTTVSLGGGTRLLNSNAIGGAISGAQAGVRVENSGTITGAVTLTGGGNVYVLAATGEQIGQASGGASAPTSLNSLQIETAAAATRTLAANRFVNFQQIDLNTLNAGQLALQGAADPVTAASLDTGGGVGSSITLRNGQLVLTEAGSSLRAETVTLAAGTRLSGIGTIFSGANGIARAEGTIAPGSSPGTLTVNGNLELTGTSELEFELGEAGVVGGARNDLIVVTGNLVLDGRVSVTQSAGGTFGPGIYRLITVNGTTTNNGLDIVGLLPDGQSGSIQVLANQVNLIVPVAGGGGGGGDIARHYWDGPASVANSVEGGTGTWSEAGTNWTSANGAAQGRWSGTFAIFQTTGGTVTVTAGYRPVFQQLQFDVGGYRIEGGGLGIEGAAAINVTGAFDTTIASIIGGTGSLDKQGIGRLILTGANTYTGGTTITEGTLAVGHDTALGTGPATLRNGSTLQAFGGDRTLANAITLSGTTGTLDTEGFRLTLTGALSVHDTLRKLGSGTLTLADPQGAVPEVSFHAMDLAAGTLENHRSLTLSGGIAMGDATTLDNRRGATITTGSTGISGGNGAQTVINAGTIMAPVSLGGGNDRYELQNFAVQTGRVDGGAGTDTAAFRVDTGNTRTIVGDQFFNFELLEKSGGGTLRLISGTDSLATATVRILGGQVINETRVNVSNSVEVKNSGNPDLDRSRIAWINTPGASVTATDPVAIRATREQVTVDNSGVVSGEVRLTGTGNTYILSTTGAQTGQVHAGNASADNRVQIDAPAAGAGRTLSQAAFVNFGQINLNQGANAAGRIVLAAAPAGQVTLDTRAIADSRATLHRGELVLPDPGSSLRAATVVLERDTVLRGDGTISTRPDGGGGLGMIYTRGVVAPGNSIGTLDFVGNYTQTGAYQVEYRPPPLGTARGRNMAEGSTLAEQDADLIRVTGAATLTGASIVPIRLGTAAAMNAARTAAGGTLHWLVLRAQGGLGGTRFVALSNTAEVSVAYPNSTDVELVLTGPVTDPPPGGGGPPPNIVVVTQPPTTLTRRDQVLYQQAVSTTASLFDLASDCYRPEGLATAQRDEQMCFFAQGRLLQGRSDGMDSYALFQAKGDPFDAFSPATGALRQRGADAAIGAVGRIGEEGWLGFALGFGEGDFSTAPVAGGHFRTRYSGLQLAALARWATGPLELRGMLGYGFREIDGQRPSALAGGEDRLSASTNQRYATLAGETRYWLGTRGVFALAPTMRLHYTDLQRDAYTETGRSADVLRADATSAQSLRLTLGLTGEIGLRVGERPVILEPRLGWQQELGDRRIETSGEFLGAPGQPVRGSGSTQPRDSALLGLAAITEISPGTRLRFGYDASLTNNAYTQAVTLRLSHAW